MHKKKSHVHHRFTKKLLWSFSNVLPHYIFCTFLRCNTFFSFPSLRRIIIFSHTCTCIRWPRQTHFNCSWVTIGRHFQSSEQECGDRYWTDMSNGRPHLWSEKAGSPVNQAADGKQREGFGFFVRLPACVFVPVIKTWGSISMTGEIFALAQLCGRQSFWLQ